MENYYCEATATTPEIKGDFSNKVISITGKCYPANSIEFFSPFNTWLNDFLNQTQQEIKLQFDLEYFNTSSSLILLNIMKKIKSKVATNQIIWLHEDDDEDMVEAGNEYNILLGNQIKVLPKSALRA